MNETMQEHSEAVLEVTDTSAVPSQLSPAVAKPSPYNGDNFERLSTLVLDEKTWERVNARRSDLIRQKYKASLTDAEQAELDDLEEMATNYLNRIAPLSDAPLDVLQAHVDRLKAKQKNGS